MDEQKQEEEVEPTRRPLDLRREWSGSLPKPAGYWEDTEEPEWKQQRLPRGRKRHRSSASSSHRSDLASSSSDSSSSSSSDDDNNDDGDDERKVGASPTAYSRSSKASSHDLHSHGWASSLGGGGGAASHSSLGSSVPGGALLTSSRPRRRTKKVAKRRKRKQEATAKTTVNTNVYSVKAAVLDLAAAEDSSSSSSLDEDGSLSSSKRSKSSSPTDRSAVARAGRKEEEDPAEHIPAARRAKKALAIKMIAAAADDSSSSSIDASSSSSFEKKEEEDDDDDDEEMIPKTSMTKLEWERYRQRERQKAIKEQKAKDADRRKKRKAKEQALLLLLSQEQQHADKLAAPAPVAAPDVADGASAATSTVSPAAAAAAAGRRKKKMPSAKRLAVVSMPKAGQGVKRRRRRSSITSSSSASNNSDTAGDSVISISDDDNEGDNDLAKGLASLDEELKSSKDGEQKQAITAPSATAPAAATPNERTSVVALPKPAPANITTHPVALPKPAPANITTHPQSHPQGERVWPLVAGMQYGQANITTSHQQWQHGKQVVGRPAGTGKNKTKAASVPIHQAVQSERDKILAEHEKKMAKLKRVGAEAATAKDTKGSSKAKSAARASAGSENNASITTKKRGRPRKVDKDNIMDKMIAVNAPKFDNPAITQPTEEAKTNEAAANPTPKDISMGYVVPTGLEDTIRKASALVSAEIRNGCWVRQWADGIHITIDSAQSEKIDSAARRNIALSSAAAALERFALEMILPSFIAAGVEEGPGLHYALDATFGDYHHRTLIATFLALREVLMMNSDAYFFDVGRDDTSRSDEPNQCTEGVERKRAGRSRSRDNDVEDAEEKALRSKLLASGVVFAALNRLDEKERDPILAELITAMGDYDAGEDTFALNLERADGRSLCVMPNGKTLGREENIAWRVSFNVARDKHPLIKIKERRDIARRLASYSESTSTEEKKKLAGSVLDGMTHRVEVPTANACALYFVEKLTSDPMGYIDPNERTKEDRARYERRAN